MDWNSNKPLNGVRSLLATDKQLTKELLTTALRAAGAGQVVAGSATDMLELVRTFAPDVIFADFDMAPFNGTVFIKHLRTEFKMATPAILVFHEEDQGVALAGAKQAGVNGAVSIPFTNDTVVKMARKVLGAR